MIKVHSKERGVDIKSLKCHVKDLSLFPTLFLSSTGHGMLLVLNLNESRIWGLMFRDMCWDSSWINPYNRVHIYCRFLKGFRDWAPSFFRCKHPVTCSSGNGTQRSSAAHNSNPASKLPSYSWWVERWCTMVRWLSSYKSWLTPWTAAKMNGVPSSVKCAPGSSCWITTPQSRWSTYATGYTKCVNGRYRFLHSYGIYFSQ